MNQMARTGAATFLSSRLESRYFSTFYTGMNINNLTRLLLYSRLVAADAQAFDLPTTEPLKRHPLLLWYQQPAQKWTEALPIGNGRISAMVFGGATVERLQLNEGALWAGGPYDPVNPQAKEALPQVRQLINDGSTQVRYGSVTREVKLARDKSFLWNGQ